MAANTIVTLKLTLADANRIKNALIVHFDNLKKMTDTAATSDMQANRAEMLEIARLLRVEFGPEMRDSVRF